MGDISKRVLKFRDPDMSSLPESYFMDAGDKSEGDLSDSEHHQRQQPTPTGRTRTDSGSFRFVWSTPSNQPFNYMYLTGVALCM